MTFFPKNFMWFFQQQEKKNSHGITMDKTLKSLLTFTFITGLMINRSLKQTQHDPTTAGPEPDLLLICH